MDSVIFRSAEEIVRNIKEQKITCVEVARQFLTHIETYNPVINAICDLRQSEEIMKEALEKDRQIKDNIALGPLHGLPITVKDSFDVKGLLTTNGNPLLKSNIAEVDAALVTRLKAAGAIILGKTNIAMFALDWQSSNKWFGQTNNPYHLDHVVGGSSGGSAASLAAGFSALELGTDAGGSIRVPAHFCGLCGLRTTESLLPMRGSMSTPGALRIGRYLTCNGPLARNVDDLMLMMDVLTSTQQEFAENPPVDIKQYSLQGKQRINVAYSLTIDNVELDNEYQEIYRNFINALTNNQQFTVKRDQPKYDNDKLITLWGKIVGFDMGVALGRLPFKRLIASLFIRNMHKDGQWAKAMGQGAGINRKQYAQALEEKDDVSDRFTEFYREFDVWVTPVSADKAFPHQKSGKPLLINGKKRPYAKAFTPFNFATTIPGHPILVIPIGMTSKGLPVGVQIHGQKWHDHKLLEIGKQMERLTKGFQVPDMFVNSKQT